jgi:Amt family ammonium transporter
MGTRPRSILALSAPALAVFGARAAFAQEAEAAAASGLNSGDVAWILMSSAIVLMMTVPGLSLFYGGLVRGKNVLSVLMQCFIAAGLVSVIWVLWGYSIAFPDPGGSLGGFFGNLDKFGLQGVSWEAGADENIPEQAFMAFQLMFAIITPALIVGSFAERMKFSAFFLFVLLWSTFIYSPLAHWVWGKGGWLAERGALDFAGGIVVHVSSGAAALVAAAMIGRRRGFRREPMPPHNVPFVIVGAALLWVGWFGFNAGSALAANGRATLAFVNTNTAAGAAMLAWMFSEWAGKGKPTAVGAATGAVAGLAAVTPAAGFVEPWAAIIIGAVAGFLCYKACNWKTKIGYDDALDVVGVHGVGGTWGVLATGVFASSALSGGGLFTGNPHQLLTQTIGVAATYALSGFGTFLILGLVNSVVGLRVADEDEEAGLDLALHAESAYSSASPSGPLGERTPRRERIAPRLAPAPSSAAPATTRQPPVATTTQRAAPVATSSAAPTTRASTVGATSGSAGGEDRLFRVVIDGVDRHALTRWWRDLCTQDHTKAPQAFREIYPNVRAFEGNTFHFRGGDPTATRERLADLLDIYGATASDVRVEEVH